MLKTLYPPVLALGSLQGFAHGNFGKPDIKTAWSGYASGRRILGLLIAGNARLAVWRRARIFNLILMLGLVTGFPGGAGTGAMAEEPVAAVASSHIPADHLQHYSDLALTWMQEEIGRASGRER